MSNICRKCQGAGIIGISAAIILNCPLHPDEPKCPYLQPHQHIHQEVYIPQTFSNLTIVATTSGIEPSHGSIVYSYEDPEREGNKIYLIDITTSGGTTT